MKSILLLANLILLIPVTVVLVQVAAASWGRRRDSREQSEPGDSMALAVLVPAHNESALLAETLTSITRQLQGRGKILVIADNCHDQTAVIAARCGAEVVERSDTVHVGKGYALDHGVRHLIANNALPPVVIVIDADCIVTGARFDEVAQRALERDRPLQLLNLTDRELPADGRSAIAELGNLLNNFVRPLGMSILGGPCQLMGTGMVVPSHLVRAGQFATSSNAEDKQLGIRLALQGHPPSFCSAARVSSRMPQGKTAFLTQRTRWEHGHLSAALWGGPRLLISGLRRRRFSLLAMAFDLAVPPIALLVMGWAALLVAGGLLFAIGGDVSALAMSVTIGGLLAVIVMMTWYCFGRPRIPFWRLAGIPFYLARKLPIYTRLLHAGREKRWIRTDRQHPLVGVTESTTSKVEVHEP